MLNHLTCSSVISCGLLRASKPRKIASKSGDAFAPPTSRYCGKSKGVGDGGGLRSWSGSIPGEGATKRRVVSQLNGICILGKKKKKKAYHHSDRWYGGMQGKSQKRDKKETTALIGNGSPRPPAYPNMMGANKNQLPLQRRNHMLCSLRPPVQTRPSERSQIRGINNKASLDQRGRDRTPRKMGAKRSTKPNSPQGESPKDGLVFGGERRCGPLSTDYGGGRSGLVWSGRGSYSGQGSTPKSKVHQMRIDHRACSKN